MNEVVARLLVVVAIVVITAGIAWLIGRFRRPPHPTVAVGEVGDRPGVVLFSSTSCPTCKDAIARLEDLGIPFREVTDDLEAPRFETWGIVAVPVTVVIDADDNVVGVFSGVPSPRSLRRAISIAGVQVR